MSTQADTARKLLNNLNLGTQKASLGDFVVGGIAAAQAAAGAANKQGAAVADAAGSEPTAGEFNALLDSLRAAGIIAAAE